MMLRFIFGFLLGFINYYIAFQSCECYKKYQTLSINLFCQQLHHSNISDSVYMLLFMLCGGFLGVFCKSCNAECIQAISAYVFCSWLFIIAYVDIKTLLIPNQYLFVLLFSGLPFLCSSFACIWQQRLYGILVPAGLMLLMNMLKKDSFGFGDIKLMIVCGFLLGGSCVITAMLLAVLSGGIYGAYLMLLKKDEMHTHIAFAPFLCISVIISYFYCDEIINIYYSLFYF